MFNLQSSVGSLSSADLLARTRDLARKSQNVEADLLVHLAEIDARKLYAEWAFSSMFEFCVKDLGFSEGAAFSRIFVARAARSLPAMFDALRSGQVHLAGLRILAPHLTGENHGQILARADGKSKREIEELVAALLPQAPVPPTIRRLPTVAPAPLLPLSAAAPPATTAPVLGVPSPQREERRDAVTPLSQESFKIVFTASRETRQTLVTAQALLRHRVPDGDIATILAMALRLLVEHVTKERFGAGRKTRAPRQPALGPASRHIPAAIRRAVFERDGGRCAFVSSDGRRCESIDGLQFDHVDGFARTHAHELDKLRLVCRAHNQHAADQMYGREFMDKARARDDSSLPRGK